MKLKNNFWIILESYNKGWLDCCCDNKNYPDDPLLKCAYEIGCSDYIIGDDVSSVDKQTNKQIVDKIRKSYENRSNN